MTERLKDRIALTAAMAGIGILYAAALNNNLVADDWLFVTPHTFIETIAYFYTSIIPPEWEALWLRPIPMFLFWLDNALWQGTTWGPHAVNIVFHLINMYLIWSLVRFLHSNANSGNQDTFGGIPALAACLVYGAHPLAVGSVAWISARFDLMCVAFGLWGLLIWLRYDAGLRGEKTLAGALFILLCALLSKEQGIVFILTCGFVSLYQLVRTKKRGHHVAGLVGLILLVGLYTVYRFSVFGGKGGYLYAFYGPSIKIPFLYACAVAFPFLNVMPDWVNSWSCVLSILVLALPVLTLWNYVSGEKTRLTACYPLVAAFVFIMGLMTTAPHAWMTIDKVMGHLESRYALIPVVGLALLAGFFINLIIRKYTIHRVVLIVVFLLTAAGVWRSSVQIQAWGKAGLIADNIIRQAVELVPNPPPESHLIFVDIPRITPQNTYVFGIGLSEALKIKYGRQDITVIRYPKKHDVRTAIPGRDYFFQYHPPTGLLENMDLVKVQNRQ